MSVELVPHREGEESSFWLGRTPEIYTLSRLFLYLSTAVSKWFANKTQTSQDNWIPKYESYPDIVLSTGLYISVHAEKFWKSLKNILEKNIEASNVSAHSNI